MLQLKCITFELRLLRHFQQYPISKPDFGEMFYRAALLQARPLKLPLERLDGTANGPNVS